MHPPAPLRHRLIRRSLLAGLTAALLTASGSQDALGQIQLTIATPDLTQEAPTADRALILNSHRTIVGHQDFLRDLLNDVARRAQLTEPVHIVFGSWPQPIAAYSTDLNLVAISYGFVADLRRRLEAAQIDDWFPALEQTLLHEMGHALVDIKNLPREAENPESVADQMGFYFMEENYLGEDLLPVIAHWATRDAPGSTSIQATSADESNLHLPDYERAIDYMCWIVGMEESIGAAAAMFGEYVADRDCSEEYARLIDNGITRMVTEYPDQQAFDDPRAYFNYLLGEGLSLDVAADWVAEEYGNAVSVDLAVYACAEPAEAQCAGSSFGAAWDRFDLLLNPLTTEQAVMRMLEEEYDPAVAVGIGLYWCSPPAGLGCPDGDLFKEVWNDIELSYEFDLTPVQLLADTRELAGELVADLVGAALCGEPTCWAGYDVQLTRSSQTFQRGQVLFEGGPKTLFGSLRGFACTFVRLGCG